MVLAGAVAPAMLDHHMTQALLLRYRRWHLRPLSLDLQVIVLDPLDQLYLILWQPEDRQAISAGLSWRHFLIMVRLLFWLAVWLFLRGNYESFLIDRVHHDTLLVLQVRISSIIVAFLGCLETWAEIRQWLVACVVLGQRRLNILLSWTAAPILKPWELLFLFLCLLLCLMVMSLALRCRNHDILIMQIIVVDVARGRGLLTAFQPRCCSITHASADYELRADNHRLKRLLK